MMQAEKVLRDAGWVEAIYGDLGRGDEFLHLPSGSLLVGYRGILNSGDKVLRAPRPEPEYEPGTVARVRDSDGDLHNAMMKEWGFWGTVDGSLHKDNVEVLRVIAYPDGSGPKESGPEADRRREREAIMERLDKEVVQLKAWLAGDRSAWGDTEDDTE